MGICFVMQPFDDDGPFDKRFEDVLTPAIEAAGLQAYRVDRDPSVSVPIDEIERQIRAAEICLADISEDNPNVWFELGFAIAARKDVVLVCSSARTTKFPFDVQHRSITRYSTDSARDFETFKEKVAARLKGTLEKGDRLFTASISSVKPVEGLRQHEIVALVTIGENLSSVNGCVPTYTIKSIWSEQGLRA